MNTDKEFEKGDVLVKRNLGAVNAMYPMPIVVIGTEVNGKINYNAIAHVGIVDHNTLSISMGKIHYSNQGIKRNRTLSINLVSSEMTEKMSYVGSASGADTDKSQVFENFYGSLTGAPMVKEAPVCMECEVIQILDRPEFDVFIVKIVNTYCDESVIAEGRIDYAQVKSLFYDMPSFGYWMLGEKIR
jgi:flavin reductase (DIM6/NTAB) family NADH-FMN oxidoreductase RutF